MNPDPDIVNIRIRPEWSLRDLDVLAGDMDAFDRIPFAEPLASDAEETMPPRAMGLRDIDRRTDRMRAWFWLGYLALWIVGIAAFVWWLW